MSESSKQDSTDPAESSQESSAESPKEGSAESIPSSVDALQARVSELVVERDKLAAKYDRLMSAARLCKADLANAIKDHKREMADALKRQPITLASKLVPTLNMFDVTLASIEDGSVKDGVAMVQKSLVDALGLSIVCPKPGDKFDSDEHMAVAQVESDYTAGTVAEVLGRGYKLDGRVLHPASVSVAKERSAD